MGTLTWPMMWALREVRMRSGWVSREEALYAPNTLDALVRRGLLEGRSAPSGYYFEAYRATNAGRAFDLSELDGIR